jgi:hypothetical protein
MPLPVNWNSSTVTVDPWVLHSASVNSSAAVKAIGDVMTAVTNRLNELRLSWTGDSQEQAEKFNSDWNAVVKQLFGTPEHPEQGILNRFCSGLETAAVGYSRGERAVSDSFAMFQGLLEGMDPASLQNQGDKNLGDTVAKYVVPVPYPAGSVPGLGVATATALSLSGSDPLLDNAPAENEVTDSLSEAEKKSLTDEEKKSLAEAEKNHIHRTSVNQTF